MKLKYSVFIRDLQLSIPFLDLSKVMQHLYFELLFEIIQTISFQFMEITAFNLKGN